MADLKLGRGVLILGAAGWPTVALACAGAAIALPGRQERMAGPLGGFSCPPPVSIDLELRGPLADPPPRVLERVLCAYRVRRRKVGPRRARGCFVWPSYRPACPTLPGV